MLKLQVVKLKKVKDIPCENPHKYSDIVELIYEVRKVSRMELMELSCRPMHKIKASLSRIPENNNLYAIFMRFTNQDVTFICQWLKIFMLANCHNFEIRATKYLSSKVLMYDNWTYSISDGQKGDILALY